MTLELIKAAALLLALSLLHGLIARHLRHDRTLAQLLSGVLFGGICIIGMLLPIEVAPGFIFDPRSVILSMASLFGGPLVALVSAGLAGGYRLSLGGGGATVGVAVIAASSLLGLAYRHGHRKGWLKIGMAQLFVFGLLVHVVVVLLFTQLPDNAVDQVMTTVATPILLIFTLATAFLGMLLQDVEVRLQTEADLLESEARLSLHLENTPLAAISWGRDFRCVQWNKTAERMFGYSADEAIGTHVADLIVPERVRPHIDDLVQALLQRQGGERNVNENLTKDGRTIICEWYNTPITNERGETVGVVSLADDITERRRAQEEIRLKNTLLTTQQEASVDGILSVDAQGKVITMNQRFIDLWRIPADIAASGSDDQLIASVLDRLVDPDSFMAKVRYLYENRRETSEDEITLIDGRVFERHSAPMLGPDGEYFGRVWMFRDITARKQSDELIWNQANFDPLTGLANRQMLRNRLEQYIKQAQRAGERIALLYLDLDHFKDVNDTLGHDTGDVLLVDAAKRLSACVREVDTVARIGGDEFIVLMGGLDHGSAVERVADAILKSLAEPFQLGDEAAYLSTSIGITFYPDDAKDVDGLLKNADHAMYAAKDRGRNCYQYFTTAMQQRAVSRMLMVKDLRVALSLGQFSMVYQPIVDLRSGEILKAEALLRWAHPARGMISPAEFIPLAEEARLIIDIGDWVFREVARQAARWRSAARPGFQIALNTSPVQYRSDNFDVGRWIAHLQEIGLSGEAISVEITEGLLLDATPKVSETLLTFRDAGIQVSLDDFGTGYSSLAYLKKFDIDYLKIDQAFVRSLEPGSDDLALCEAIIVMAHRLGLKVIAEGVETERQRELLASAGCDYGQGYLFSRPVDAAAFEQLLGAPLPARPAPGQLDDASV